MNPLFENYLDKVDKSLRPLPISERIDIIKEIKSSILEMESEQISDQDILDRLGKPEDLAKAYLGNLLAEKNKISWNRILTVFAFYSFVGFSGLIVIPTLAILAPSLMICAFIAPLLSAIKLIDRLFHLNIPFIHFIGVRFFDFTLDPISGFFVSLLVGIFLFWLGRSAWKLLLAYCTKVSRTKRHFPI